MILIDESDGHRFVDLFVSEFDIPAAEAHPRELEEWNKAEPGALKAQVDRGQLVRIGPMPRRLGLYRRD
jgi:hypothetical protein